MINQGRALPSYRLEAGGNLDLGQRPRHTRTCMGLSTGTPNGRAPKDTHIKNPACTETAVSVQPALRVDRSRATKRGISKDHMVFLGDPYVCVAFGTPISAEPSGVCQSASSCF